MRTYVTLLLACGGGAPSSSSGAVTRQQTEGESSRPFGVVVDAHSTQDVRPPPARRQDVIDEYHGIRVADPYRWLETPSTERDAWFKAQNDYTRRVLSTLPGRDALRDQLREVNRDVERVALLKVVGPRPRVFSLRQGANDETPKLVVREGWDGADRILVDPIKRSNGGSHVTIDVAYPSADGRYVAYVVSSAGSEDGTIEIIDVVSGKRLPDRIDRTRAPIISWRPDGRSFFYWRRAKSQFSATPADLFKNSATYLHVIGDDPNLARPVIGAGMSELGLGSHDYTAVEVAPQSRWVLARAIPTIGKVAFFVARLPQVRPGRTRWQRVARTDDKIQRMLAYGDRLYALGYAGAPNYRIVSFEAKPGGLAKGKDFVAESDLVLDDFAAARDAMYVVALDSGVHRLFRVPWKTAVRQEVALPFAGSIRKLISDQSRSGLVFSMEGWVEQPRWFQFDPATGNVREVLVVSSAAASERLMTEQIAVVSRDGTEVPLSIVRRQGNAPDAAAPALLTGYGAYGVALTPTYNPFTLTWVKRGGVYAICHVRGGGERGSSWHQAGIKQGKEKGVDDFIACAEYLLKKRYTESGRLTAFGGSAGGIVLGGAITKRPDLFKAAAVLVGQLNPLRHEVTAGGQLHLEEFGNPKVEAEFRSLLASDPYHRIREGIDYPAVLLTAGAHDLRVPMWLPGKFAARLQATGRARLALLRIDYDTGHGFTSTQTQREEEYADIYAFALWQAGIGVR